MTAVFSSDGSRERLNVRVLLVFLQPKNKPFYEYLKYLNGLSQLKLADSKIKFNAPKRANQVLYEYKTADLISKQTKCFIIKTTNLNVSF